MSKSALNEALTVYLNHYTRDLKVGRLAIKDRRVFFEYDTAFLDSAIEISPFKLPLKAGVFSPENNLFDGLFGVFNDSLPDGWGRLLLDRLVEKHGIQRGQLTVLDRLAYVGHNGMGALQYEPDRSLTVSDQAALNLDKLAEEANIVLEGEHEEVFEDLLALNGSSAGARPKIMAQVSTDKRKIIHGTQIWQPGYEHWIIKFSSSQDRKDIGSIEYAYSLMARAAGVKMPETYLFPTQKNAYFGAKRFDRHENVRVHMHSLSGLIHADHRVPSLDYGTFLKVVMLLTRNAQDVEKAYILACFNVLAHNRDDHAKNFSFLLNDRNEWVFAPAYDLTFSYGPGGEQSTMVLGEGRKPTIKLLLDLGQKHGINKREYLLEQVSQAVAQWGDFAEQAGVSPTSKQWIQNELHKHRLAL